MQNKHSSELKELLTNVEAALIQAGQNARKLAEQTGTKLIIVEKVPTNAQSTQGTASIRENTLKTMLTYIHGFNSCAISNTFRLLRAEFPDAQALEYPSDGLFDDNLHSLYCQLQSLQTVTGTPPLIVGTSLGGFYASQLAALCGANCALFNPVIYPAQTLRQFLGRNVHLHTGVEWDFTEACLESYATFTDTRSHFLQRFVVLGRNDSLLNPQDARLYWQGHAQFHETEDEHSLAALDEHTICTLKSYL